MSFSVYRYRSAKYEPFGEEVDMKRTLPPFPNVRMRSTRGLHALARARIFLAKCRKMAEYMAERILGISLHQFDLRVRSDRIPDLVHHFLGGVRVQHGE